MNQKDINSLPLVKDFIAYFKRQSYPNLFSTECTEKLHNIEEKYGNIHCLSIIQEVVLTNEERTSDYSIQVEVDETQKGDGVNEYWYELDWEAYKAKDVPPCYFIDASAVKSGMDNSSFYKNALVALAGAERATNLSGMLEKCVSLLNGKCPYLYQIGAMNAREQMDRIRIFTQDMKKEDILSYLKSLDWTGDAEKLEEMLSYWEPYSDHKMFIIDFDVFSNHISEKIGINFGTKNKRYKTVETFLNALVDSGLCLKAKRDDIFRWNRAYPSAAPFMLNDISHFKLPFSGGKILGAKAYLRQTAVNIAPYYRAYETPLLMNLELTTRCPLHCPQCYCDLTYGKDLDFGKALYWIREAAAERVKTVNLSGGETLCYPHLTELVSECARLGLESNIALSGAFATKEKLEELITAGVNGIFVSLNGSTELLNSKTRDGYQLALSTLQLLKELHFPNVCINWVMHSYNAADFPNMISLAQDYDVKEITVMVFKPNSAHELPSLPNEEQMRTLAKIIKTYKGPLKITVENCFSQMRALVNEHYLANLNTGIQKGCGAGRDGISINVDGTITPCRHLEFPEEYLSIRDYWYHSPVLRILRGVEDSIEAPCSNCSYKRNCLPCAAVNAKMKGRIAFGDKTCPLGKELLHPEEESEDELILVDSRDKEIGYERKLAVHQKGLLHRAFSVFITNSNGELLIQKRAEGKYHSGGLWANTCCSHPRRGELLQDAAQRRLVEEAGLNCEVKEIGHFIYRATFDNGLSEYEFDHVFAGLYDGNFVRNESEASEMKWVNIEQLECDTRLHPEKYAAWFITAFPLFMERFNRHATSA